MKIVETCHGRSGLGLRTCVKPGLALIGRAVRKPGRAENIHTCILVCRAGFEPCTVEPSISFQPSVQQGRLCRYYHICGCQPLRLTAETAKYPDNSNSEAKYKEGQERHRSLHSG